MTKHPVTQEAITFSMHYSGSVFVDDAECRHHRWPYFDRKAGKWYVIIDRRRRYLAEAIPHRSITNPDAILYYVYKLES